MAKIVGAKIDSVPVSVPVSVPFSLYGKSISLNLAECKWFEAPSRSPELSMNGNRPTIQVPGPGAISDIDYKCIVNKLKAGHFVLGPKPNPAIVKDPEKMEELVSIMRTPYDTGAFIELLKSKIINGPNTFSGWNKLEVIQTLIKTEERTETNKTGKNRKEVLHLLREAEKYLAARHGGVSAITNSNVGGDASYQSHEETKFNQESAKEYIKKLAGK